jgi:hypothetical protein
MAGNEETQVSPTTGQLSQMRSRYQQLWMALIGLVDLRETALEG